MICDDVKTLISAYQDGELSREAASRVAAHLDQCAVCRGMAEDLALLSRDIRLSGRAPAPQRLRERVLSALAEEKKVPAIATANIKSVQAGPSSQSAYLPDWRQLAAVLTLCIATSAATFVATQRHDSVVHLESDLVAAHTRALLQDNPVQVASSDNHTVRPWFAGRVDFAPNVKDMAGQGFALIGGRLDVVGGQRVAVAVYKHGNHWINVYIWPASAPLPVPDGVATRNGYNVLTWRRDGVVYSAVSDANADEMRTFERLLQ